MSISVTPKRIYSIFSALCAEKGRTVITYLSPAAAGTATSINAASIKNMTETVFFILPLLYGLDRNYLKLAFKKP